MTGRAEALEHLRTDIASDRAGARAAKLVYQPLYTAAPRSRIAVIGTRARKAATRRRLSGTARTETVRAHCEYSLAPLIHPSPLNFPLAEDELLVRAGSPSRALQACPGSADDLPRDIVHADLVGRPVRYSAIRQPEHCEPIERLDLQVTEIRYVQLGGSQPIYLQGQ